MAQTSHISYFFSLFGNLVVWFADNSLLILTSLISVDLVVPISYSCSFLIHAPLSSHCCLWRLVIHEHAQISPHQYKHLYICLCQINLTLSSQVGWEQHTDTRDLYWRCLKWINSAVCLPRQHIFAYFSLPGDLIESNILTWQHCLKWISSSFCLFAAAL